MAAFYATPLLVAFALRHASAQVLPLSATCAALANATFPVEYAANPDYSYQQSQYWSAAASELLPACILVPQTPDDVSTIVKTLRSNNDQFAIKGGGHSPNLNFSSIAGGPLISMSGFKEVTYDAETNSVRVGSGNRWEDVQKALDPLNVTVVGGRIGHVGVGGLLLGEGFSFLTSQYGWGANGFVAVELVLANGTFITASWSSHPELFTALKGGGNNFGIVTTYILAAHPIGLIYGGTLSIPVTTPESDTAVLNAIYNFTAGYANYPKAAIIPTREVVQSTLASVWIIFVFYDGPVPPPGTFDMFTTLGVEVSTAITQPYSQYLITNDASIPKGFRFKMGTETTPLPYGKNSTAVMQAYHDKWLSITNSLAGVAGLVGTIAWQPFPRIAAQAALSRGSDLLAIDADVDRIIWELDYAYSLGTDDQAVNDGLIAIAEGFHQLGDEFIAQGAVPNAYRPLFMNDANYKQDYFGRMRTASHVLAKAVSWEFDPSGFFQRRTDGFRP